MRAGQILSLNLGNEQREPHSQQFGSIDGLLYKSHVQKHEDTDYTKREYR